MTDALPFPSGQLFPRDPQLLRRKIINYIMFSLTGVATILVISGLFMILGYLLFKGFRYLNWDFLSKLPVPVGETGGGLGNAIVGSAKILAIATCIGVPIGFLGGVFLAEYRAPRFAFVVRYATDLLNGVPSIVIGIFAYTIIVLNTKHFSAWAGGFALGIMMIPIALRSTEEFLRAVPKTLREAGLALGATRWQVIVTIVIPAAMRGIIGGMLLDVARVAGETAPLLFTAFGSPFWSKGINEPTAALPVVIFNYAISPYDDWHQQAWAAGFVLLSLVLLFNITARLLYMARKR